MTVRNGLHANLRGAIRALALDVELDCEGGTLVIVGPNGAGKTSLLRMLLGGLEPADGRLVVAGEVLFDGASAVNVPIERRRLGYVPQDYALFPHLSVRDNVGFAIADCAHRTRRGHGADVREKIDVLLRDFDLTALASRRPDDLSGGEKQRVALARALCGNPRALLLDEPLAALDAGARREVRAYLAAWLERLGLPAVVVTHDAADARWLGGTIAVLERGRISQRGTWSDLSRAPATHFVEEFVRE